MARKRQRKKKRSDTKKETLVVEAIEPEVLDDPEMLPSGYAEEMLTIAIAEVMKGCNGLQLQERMKNHGYDMGRDKAYRLLKYCRQEVAKIATHDYEEHYAFVVNNYLDLHRQAVETKDTRLQVVCLKELSDIWALKRQPEKQEEKEITPELVEKFEQALLR